MKILSKYELFYRPNHGFFASKSITFEHILF